VDFCTFLICLLWTSSMRCEASTAGCAEVSLRSVVYAMTGFDNCPLSSCQSLHSINWIGAFQGISKIVLTIFLCPTDEL